LELGALRTHVAKRTCSPLNFRGVNFTEQQKYLKRGRVWADLAALLTLVSSFLLWSIFCVDGRIPGIVFTLVIIAVAGSLVYTPDYLHLNVNLTKRARWQIKIRWRLIAVGFVIGVLSEPTVRGVVTVSVACFCFAAVNIFAKTAVTPRYSSVYFWITDCLLVAALSLITQLHFMVVMAFIIATAHLAIVTCEKHILLWTGVVTVSGSALFLALLLRFSENLEGTPWADFAVCAGLILIFTMTTALLVARTQRQNARNVGIAMHELAEFTGYSDDKIRALWATSNQQLATNWKEAHLDESDREKMTAWYRENSELYMFAISGYNLEYKRIRDSIKMLRYGRGACLDYGAGNGEIILELARRGHAAIYFDVDGTSMRFARHRAERQKLAVEFFHSKDDLAASAKQRGLDTIFSFDVLEHLPDLPGELKFLSLLLNSGGRMVFDVPAGSTKAHPMHLNHHLEINAYMESIGMVEERRLLQSIPFRKQEKYVFRKPA
jgi:2-polyprenyl-3-methyl-5-hydroxy-6-metoxy-1,4-benzoquinol methylase